jgi:hypothetical protein
MAAPDGNSNALIWTTEKVDELLNDLEKLTEDENIIYLGQALALCKTSNRQWRRIKERYKDTEEIIERMELIEEDLIQRMVVGAAFGRLRGNVVTFVLKHKCGFADEAKEQKEQQKEQQKAERQPRRKKDDTIDEATLAALQEVTGPLLETHLRRKENIPLFRTVAGMTKEQLDAEGYHVQNGVIFEPDSPYIRVSETENIYL